MAQIRSRPVTAVLLTVALVLFASPAAAAGPSATAKKFPTEVSLKLGQSTTLAGTVESTSALGSVTIIVEGTTIKQTFSPTPSSPKQVSVSMPISNLTSIGRYKIVVSASGSSGSTTVTTIPLLVMGETNRDGQEFIIRWEGFVDHLYNDTSEKHNCTIGYGVQLHDNPCKLFKSSKGQPEEKYYNDKGGYVTLSPYDAFYGRGMARDRIRASEKAVNALVTSSSSKARLNQDQFNALVSLHYNYPNMGPKLKQALLANDLKEAGKQFVDGWEKKPQFDRRKDERKMFENGTYIWHQSPGFKLPW